MAFALDHAFNAPLVFYGGKGLHYDLANADRRLIKVHVPLEDLQTPKYLLVEDGELDFLGFVKKDQSYIPLQLYQIHDARPGRPEAPVTDCKTYLAYNSDADTILVMIDGKYFLRGMKAGPGRYMIRFCETTREHSFRILGPATAGMALNGQSPVAYSQIGKGAGASGSFRRQIAGSGGTLPVPYDNTGGTKPVAPAQSSTEPKTETTKVIFSMPRSMQSAPWVYLNDKRLTDFTLNAARNQITFRVNKNGQNLRVRVGDNTCECQGSGRALHSVLELSGYCECRDVQVFVNLDPELDRFRNRIHVYVDGQLSSLRMPPAGQPIVFSVRKTDRNQRVEIMLVMPDDAGNPSLFEVCKFSVPTETTTVNLSPPCHCAECPPNLKVSG
ncbi:MAG: hypothetical protein IPH12_15890 [Saprospirales bacterium]|nr:hypothetical protein [Saprospirales bacterium]